MRKIKRSNKPFEAKKKTPCNNDIGKKKNTNKIFPQQRKEVLNSHNVRKSWFNHEAELRNLESFSENANSRKIQ